MGYSTLILTIQEGEAHMPGAKTKTFAIAAGLTASSVSLNASDDDHTGQDFAPSASPDGKYVVYYSYRGSPGDLSDLYITNIATGKERRLTNTHGFFEIEPEWSPDGSEIMFAGGPSMKELALYSVKTDGSNYRPMYDGEGAGPPEWSPDGSRMAFWKSYEDGSSEPMIMNFETSQSRLLETGLRGKNSSPTFSPDQSTIAFSHRAIDDTGNEFEQAEADDGIYFIDIKTRDVRRLTGKPTIAYALTWAASGDIFYMGPDAEGVMHIFRIKAAGGEPVQVTPAAYGPAYFPSTTEDGQWLLFSGQNAAHKIRNMRVSLGDVLSGNDFAAQEITREFVNQSTEK